MNSLTYKLAAIFLVIALIPTVIGINGTLALQTANKALDDTNLALENLSNNLSEAGNLLNENVTLQNNASSITAEIANTNSDTASSLRFMGDVMLPRSFAIAQLRSSLSEATAAERALLLAVNMRHLVGQDLEQARATQLANLDAALDKMATARNAFQSLLLPGDDTRAWDRLEEAFAQWQANHAEFMAKISELDRMVADLIRGGPLFAQLSREAYDILFVTGREIRAECEIRIADLNNGLASLAQSSVQAAAEKQGYATRLADDLARDTSAAVSQVGALGTRFVSARQAADAAALQSAGALAATSRRFWYMVVFSGLGVGVAIAIGIVISWRISGPVRHMVQHMSRLADGDLTRDVEAQDMRRTDEIGQLARALQRVIESERSEITMANHMAAGDYTKDMPLRSEHDQLGQALSVLLRTTDAALTSVSRAIDEVGDGANAVSDASRSLSQGAQTSAVALEEISQTVNEVDKQTQENAANARQANQLATESRLAAKRGYGAMTELMAAMGEIQEAGKKIAVVAKLIDDIAFQTNLLSLNAAVEAARAGRQGKGFSVVADEVRNLSGRSAKAARETREMVEAMAKRMEAGAELAAHTDKEFRDIVSATEKVAFLFENIAEASVSQSQAMEQIAGGLGQIDSVIQENTMSAEKTAMSALTLSRQADELRRMVSRFKLSNNPSMVRARRGRPDRRIELADYDQDAKLLSGPNGEDA